LTFSALGFPPRPKNPPPLLPNRLPEPAGAGAAGVVVVVTGAAL